MRNLLIRFFINASALWLADFLFSGIYFQNDQALLIAAIVFGLLNAIIKPVLIILTLPVNILTLGLFTIVINAIILELTDYFIDRFMIDTFGTAILASLFISVISIILNKIFKEK